MGKDNVTELHPGLVMVHGIPNVESHISASAWQLPSKTTSTKQRQLVMQNLKNQQLVFNGRLNAMQDD